MVPLPTYIVYCKVMKAKETDNNKYCRLVAISSLSVLDPGHSEVVVGVPLLCVTVT